MKRTALAFLLVFLFSACSDDNNEENGNIDEPVNSIPNISYTIQGSYPHDTSFFTQGLTFYDGRLLEGTGSPDQNPSRLMEVDLKTGKALKEVVLDKKYFGEGITVLNDAIYQLTWRENVVFVYDAKTFKKIKEFPIATEGWGITTDGKQLIVSDGTNNLYFYEPSSFKLIQKIGVTENGSPAPNINELEFINGYVYANQWQYPFIFKIDVSTGNIVGKMDLTEVVQRVKAKEPKADFLNGIAYDSTTKKIYVTGKLWPEMYEIQFAL